MHFISYKQKNLAIAYNGFNISTVNSNSKENYDDIIIIITVKAMKIYMLEKSLCIS